MDDRGPGGPIVPSRQSVPFGEPLTVKAAETDESRAREAVALGGVFLELGSGRRNVGSLAFAEAHETS